VKRRVFPPLLCAIVLGVIPWRFSFRFVVSFRRTVYRFEPKSKNARALNSVGVILILLLAWEYGKRERGAYAEES